LLGNARYNQGGFSAPFGNRVMLEEFLDQKVVVDFRSEYVCLGVLKSFDDYFLELKNADLHDLRDTETSRENYIAASMTTGIKRNRKRVLLSRMELIAISRFEDVVDE
jgi:small nuclear ribonucleoprotein (snRNP)-like protein